MPDAQLSSANTITSLSLLDPPCLYESSLIRQAYNKSYLWEGSNVQFVLLHWFNFIQLYFYTNCCTMRGRLLLSWSWKALCRLLMMIEFFQPAVATVTMATTKTTPSKKTDELVSCSQYFTGIWVHWITSFFQNGCGATPAHETYTFQSVRKHCNITESKTGSRS